MPHARILAPHLRWVVFRQILPFRAPPPVDRDGIRSARIARHLHPERTFAVHVPFADFKLRGIPAAALFPDGEILIFFIYKSQHFGSTLVNESVKSQNSSIQDISIQDINNLSGEQKQISSSKNIIKIILNQRDLRKNSYQFLCPNFKEEDIIKIINYDILNFVSRYMHSIENDIFNKYSFIKKIINIKNYL